jgi:hypothetical protein
LYVSTADAILQLTCTIHKKSKPWWQPAAS